MRIVSLLPKRMPGNVRPPSSPLAPFTLLPPGQEEEKGQGGFTEGRGEEAKAREDGSEETTEEACLEGPAHYPILQDQQHPVPAQCRSVCTDICCMV